MGLGGLGDKETGCRYQSVHKQPLGWDLGTWVYAGLGDKETGCRYQSVHKRGGLGDKETGCRYQSVHKQPFRLGLGDLGLGGTLSKFLRRKKKHVCTKP